MKSEPELLAQYYLKAFYEKDLDDVPETVPALSGEMTRSDWIERMGQTIDKLDEIRFERNAR